MCHIQPFSFLLTVNGAIPGPTIYCNKGDRVRILVRNYMINEETFSLHVHGIWQRGTPYMDGTHGSQCPIMAGESFLYDFNVGDQVRALHSLDATMPTCLNDSSLLLLFPC